MKTTRLQMRKKYDPPKPIRRSKCLLKPTIPHISYCSTSHYPYRYVLRLFAQDRSCSPATPRVMSDEMAMEKMSEPQGTIYLTLHQPSRKECQKAADATSEASVGKDEWLRKENIRERKEDLQAFSQDCTMAKVFGCGPGGVLPAWSDENGNAKACVFCTVSVRLLV